MCSPRIYVASLSDYNAGRLHGSWIDADQDADDIRGEVSAMLAESTEEIAEEWAIHDYEGFCGVPISEYEDFDRIAELAQLIAEHGEAYAAYVDHVGEEYATEGDFEDAFRGQWDGERAYAEELFDECYLSTIPESLRFYVDYAAFARDLFVDSCVAVDARDGGVFVFDR